MSPEAARYADPRNAFAGQTGGGRPARSLPPSAYESLGFQSEEDLAIWSRTWVCVGFAEDIPGEGDVLPYTVGHHGIHVERLAGGTLAGRFNKAQHGGCRAVPLQCQTGAKTRCSFTSCGYSRDRRPIRASDPDRARYLDQYFGLRPERLLPVEVQAWGPLLVAKLDPREDASLSWPDAAPYFDGASRAEGETVWHEYNANWKHLAVALADVENTSFTTSAILFPNAIILSASDRTLAIVLQPVALDRTLCRIRAYTRSAVTLDDGAIADVLRAVAVKAAIAEAAQAPARNAPCQDDVDIPRRAWFEAQVWHALDAASQQKQVGALYRTNEKGLHR